MKHPFFPLSRKRVPAEWLTFMLALIVVGVLVVLVLYVWVTDEQQPPILSITQGEIRSTQGQFYVPFTVENQGGGTAESVQVIAELRIGEATEESGEQQIDFLAGGETEEGAFIFTHDPRTGDLRVRVASYKLP